MFQKKILSFSTYLLLIICLQWNTNASAEAFYIENYDINIKLNEESSFEVTEVIDVMFTQQRRGIIRKIPFRYKAEKLPKNTPMAKRFQSIDGYFDLLITDVKVNDWEYKTTETNGYIRIRIGSPDRKIRGRQRYVIKYKVYNAINFFEAHSEFYWNVIGDEWDVSIEKANYRVQLYRPISPNTIYFAASGRKGQRGKKATANFDGGTLSGKLNQPLRPHEGLTIGLKMPEGYLNPELVPIEIFANDYYVSNYDVHVQLNNTSVFTVTEKIEVIPISNKKKKVSRIFPKRFDIANRLYKNDIKQRFDENSQHRLLIDEINVPNNAFSTASIGNDYYVTFAEKPTKSKVYTLTYKAYDAIQTGKLGRVQLDWNLFGHQITEPIQKASYRIDFASNMSPTTNYFVKEKNKREEGTGMNGQTIRGKIDERILPGETVVLAVDFPEQSLQRIAPPVSALADKFYVKNQDAKVTVNQDGSAEVEEMYTLHLLQNISQFTRKLPNSHTVNDRFSTAKWLGGTYKYLVEDISVTDEKTGKTTNYGNNRNLLKIKIDQPQIGQDRTFVLNYRLYGNTLASGRKGLDQFVHPKMQSWSEPVVQSQLSVQLPDGMKPQANQFRSKLWKGGHKMNTNVAPQMIGNSFVVSNNQLLEPDMRLDYDLVLPSNLVQANSYFSNLQLSWMNNKILAMPFMVFGLLFLLWWFFGKDKPIIKMARYRPPSNLNPAESGILIDDYLHDRDLLALLPYWADKGHIHIKELNGGNDFEFILLKPLEGDAYAYEKTMFNGLFKHNSRSRVKLSSLKHKFYTYFQKARRQLDQQIRKRSFYVWGTRGFATFLSFIGLVGLAGSGFLLFASFGNGFYNDGNIVELTLVAFISTIIIYLFSQVMPKKAPLGLEAYQHLYGFKMFVEAAELPRLEMLLKEEPDYFSKTLPYAIVFDRAREWAEQFRGLTLEPPEWYTPYNKRAFSVDVFMDGMDKTIRSSGDVLTSTPPSKGRSGGSSSWGGSGGSFGGGGFSGGGFGGGGGSSW